uniref:Uncharacterized protein n=1 Tax=Dunaliella tertiolecta TaxID=3047 RepID=A0A7S3QMX7_DUNTE
MQATTKSFYVDLKENNRGRYLKVAEKGKYRAKSSVVVPASGVPQFLTLMRFYLDEAEAGRIAQPQDLIVESKIFSFNAGSNDRGQFLRVFERGGGFPTGGSSLMIPNGLNNTYLRMFVECLEKIAAQLGDEAYDFSQNMPSVMPILASSSPDVVNLECKETGPVLSVGSKHFFFESRSNSRGPFMRIKEVSGGMKNLLVVPMNAITQFQEAINLAAAQQPQQENGPGAANTAA